MSKELKRHHIKYSTYDKERDKCFPHEFLLSPLYCYFSAVLPSINVLNSTVTL